MTVNKPHGERPTAVYPHDKLPKIDLGVAPPDGSRQKLLALGPEDSRRHYASRRRLRSHRHTFRDAHQSLLATRVRTSGLLDVAGPPRAG